MKKLLILFSAAITLTFSACLKNTAFYNDLSKTGLVAELPLSGISNFGADAVTAPGDTITLPFVVNIASSSTPTTAHTITVAPDFTQVATYEAYDNSIAYLAMPSAAFVFPATTVTIPAGKSQATVNVTFYKHLLDPTKSYMLPLSITAAAGLTISGNFGIHYFHFIGNPLVGSFKHDYLRYNNGIGPTAGPPSTASIALTSILSPVNPTQFEVPTNYPGVGVRYEVSFTNTNGVFSNFQVIFNAADVASFWTASGISIVNQPVITTADPVNGVYEFYYTVKNGAGALRYIDDKYYH